MRPRRGQPACHIFRELPLVIFRNKHPREEQDGKAQSTPQSPPAIESLLLSIYIIVIRIWTLIGLNRNCRKVFYYKTYIYPYSARSAVIYIYILLITIFRTPDSWKTINSSDSSAHYLTIYSSSFALSLSHNVFYILGIKSLRSFVFFPLNFLRVYRPPFYPFHHAKWWWRWWWKWRNRRLLCVALYCIYMLFLLLDTYSPVYIRSIVQMHLI